MSEPTGAPADTVRVLVGRSGAAWRVEATPWFIGGQALIYRAIAEDDGHPVVVKVAREPGDPDVRAEAELLLRLGLDPTLGPAIVPAWDVGEWDDRPFVVLARMEGTLQDAVCAPLPERLALLRRAVDAVRTLHAAGLVHGDLKPTNVLLDGDGATFLADFGAAGGGGSTRGFVPPETIPGARPSPARDRWALAGTAWVVLVGALPSGEPASDRAAFDAAVPGRAALREALLALRHPSPWRRPRDLAALDRALGGARAPLDRPLVAAVVALVLLSVPVTDAPCPEGYTLAGNVCARADGTRLVRVPPARFRMGTSGPEDADGTRDAPSHEVTLTRGFWMMEAEVTQAEWARVLGENPVATRTTEWGALGEGPCATWLGDSLLGHDRPAVCVSWRDVVDYAIALSTRDGLAPAYRIDGDDVTWDPRADGWRMPTEAEWERAARGGETRPWAGAPERDASCEYANTRDASAKDRYPNDVKCDDGAPVLAPVRSYRPNALGLYDMHGNAREWVWDIYGPYGGDAQDPAGPAWGLDRVMRGQGWYDSAFGVARRVVVPTDTRVPTGGARLVRSYP